MLSRVSKESPVRLDQLDDHLKVILKFKIREFVHLSPCFRDIPSIDTASYPACTSQPAPVKQTQDAGCPNRLNRIHTRKRYVRHAVI